MVDQTDAQVSTVASKIQSIGAEVDELLGLVPSLSGLEADLADALNFIGPVASGIISIYNALHSKTTAAS